MSVPVASSRLKAIHSSFVSWNMKSSGKFTLARYVHLLSNDRGAPLDLREELDGGNLGEPKPPGTAETERRS